MSFGERSQEAPGEYSNGGGEISDGVTNPFREQLPTTEASQGDTGVERSEGNDEGEEGFGEPHGGVEEEGGQVLDCLIKEDQRDEQRENLVCEASEVIHHVG